jgi:hypothetical protein
MRKSESVSRLSTHLPILKNVPTSKYSKNSVTFENRKKSKEPQQRADIPKKSEIVSTLKEFESNFSVTYLIMNY